jgi:hypothetical protein
MLYVTGAAMALPANKVAIVKAAAMRLSFFMSLFQLKNYLPGWAVS